MVDRIVGDQDQVGLLVAREVEHAPGIDLDHLAGVLDLDARVDQRRDLDRAAGGRYFVGRKGRRGQQRTAAASSRCARITATP